MSSETPTRLKETILDVPNGRTLAFANNGDPTSSLVLMFFTGALSIGNADEMSPYLAPRGAHYISITTPGFGNTSPCAKGVSYPATIVSDATAILNHFYPDSQELELYVGGGSFGTVSAQILYGSSFDIFPRGRDMKGLLLVSMFPPTQTKHKYNWAKGMTWPNWLLFGPPASLVPFQLVQRFISVFVGHQLKTKESSEKFIREFNFEKMKDQEKVYFKTWREKRGRSEEEVVQEFAEITRRSVANTWEGFLRAGDVIRSDWWNGKKLEDLDEVLTAKRSVLIAAGKEDDVTPLEWSEFAISVYPNARLKLFEGGHISALFHMEEIFQELLSGSPTH